MHKFKKCTIQNCQNCIKFKSQTACYKANSKSKPKVQTQLSAKNKATIQKATQSYQRRRFWKISKSTKAVKKRSNMQRKVWYASNSFSSFPNWSDPFRIRYSPSILKYLTVLEERERDKVSREQVFRLRGIDRKKYKRAKDSKRKGEA